MQRNVPVPALCGLVLPAVPASADAIDGNWCSPKGQSFTIQGPQIDTPGGHRLQDIYDRHGFLYTVPDAEPDAGKQVRMVLVSDDTVRSTVGDGAAEIEMWRRCRPGIS